LYVFECCVSAYKNLLLPLRFYMIMICWFLNYVTFCSILANLCRLSPCLKCNQLYLSQALPPPQKESSNVEKCWSEKKNLFDCSFQIFFWAYILLFFCFPWRMQVTLNLFVTGYHPEVVICSINNLFVDCNDADDADDISPSTLPNSLYRNEYFLQIFFWQVSKLTSRVV